MSPGEPHPLEVEASHFPYLKEHLPLRDPHPSFGLSDKVTKRSQDANKVLAEHYANVDRPKFFPVQNRELYWKALAAQHKATIKVAKEKNPVGFQPGEHVFFRDAKSREILGMTQVSGHDLKEDETHWHVPIDFGSVRSPEEHVSWEKLKAAYRLGNQREPSVRHSLKAERSEDSVKDVQDTLDEITNNPGFGSMTPGFRQSITKDLRERLDYLKQLHALGDQERRFFRLGKRAGAPTLTRTDDLQRLLLMERGEWPATFATARDFMLSLGNVGVVPSPGASPRLTDWRSQPPAARRPGSPPVLQGLVAHGGGTISVPGALPRGVLEHGGGTFSLPGANRRIGSPALGRIAQRPGQGMLPQQAQPGDMPQASVAFPADRPKRALSVAGEFGQRAKKEGIPPRDLHDLAAMLRAHHEEHRGTVIEALNRAREFSRNMGWGDLQTLAARNARGKLDPSMLPGFDEIAREFEQRYPDLVEGGNAEETLFNLLLKGHPPELTHQESYEQALEHLMERKHGKKLEPPRERQPGEEEELPFSGTVPILFARSHLDTVDEELYRQICSLIPSTKPFRVPFTLGKVDGNEVCVADFDVYKVQYDMDTVEGANDLETDWPQKEFGSNYLLVDVNVALHEWAWILYHEAHERRLMAQGMDYDTAHEHANNCERQLRLRARKREYIPAHFDRSRVGFLARLGVRS